MCDIAFCDLVAFFAFCLTGETSRPKRERVSATRRAFWLYCGPEMKTDRVDRHRSRRPAGRVAGWVEILRPASQAG